MNILSVDYYADDAAADFTKSLKETGFAVLKTHPIDWELIQTVYQEWEAFFKSGNADKTSQSAHSLISNSFDKKIRETAFFHNAWSKVEVKFL